MLKSPSTVRSALLGVTIGAALVASGGSARAANTPFQQDVATAIDRGIEYLANTGVFGNPSTNGPASGLAMQALLEKRASGVPTDPPQGYVGASPTDQARLRTAAAYILGVVNGAGFYAYSDGQWMFALSGYALTNGPDKSALSLGAGYLTIKQAMDALVDRTLAAQNSASTGYPLAKNQGYWCYYGPGCEDSSTTQFAAAGLHAAKTFYLTNKSGDGGPWADLGRVALIEAALARTKTAYELNAAQGSDNASCSVVSQTERGHGYNSNATSGYLPSLAQTASGVYIQLFGGSNINTPSVQNYVEWLRNHYRWQDLDNMGNFWPGLSWSYYMWSSFKAMELVRQSGITPTGSNLGPDSFGLLAANASCNARQVNKVPATLARVPSFGAGGVGYYGAEAKSQYFDYAHQILSLQCYDGTLPIDGNDGAFTCNGSPGFWDETAHQSYLLLVLQRSVGNVTLKCDVDGDGDVDTADLGAIRIRIGQLPAANDPRDANADGKINLSDVRICSQRCTKANCAP